MFSRRSLSQLLVPLFSLTILALLSPAWSDGPPASSKDRARTITVVVETPDPVDPLPVQPGQVIDERSGKPIWIVMLDERPAGRNPAAASIDQSIDAVLRDAGVDPNRPSHRYRHAIVGFAAALTPIEAGRLAVDPRVEAVDPAREAKVDRLASNTRSDSDSEASWEHRRISNPQGDATSLDRCGATGAGVTVIVIDSGVNAAHSEVKGRVVESVNFTDDGGDGSDIWGHGTSVASIAAGSTIGVAPAASIASLRAFKLVPDGSGGTTLGGSTPDIIAALDWTTGHADDLRPATVNMSLGGSLRGELDTAYESSLAAVTDAGIAIFVSAGNDSLPASWQSPAVSVFTTTIGATDGADHPSPFSNFGPFVDLWAPGSAILCADWQSPDGGLVLDDGTSEATPIATGVAALYLERHPPSGIELEFPGGIALRTRLALLASAAESRLSDRDDPVWASPGGNAILGGAANLLLQSCDRVTGYDAQPIVWTDGVASIRMGDGITPVPADHGDSQIVSHPDGPVELTLGVLSFSEVSLDPSSSINDTRVRVIDLYDDRVLFDSDAWINSGPTLQTAQRTIRSTTNAGVRIDWEPKELQGDRIPGFGYAMTAIVVDPCPGDLDGDRLVNGLDLQRLLVQWGPCPTDGPCSGDLNGDGEINGGDLAILFIEWGACQDVPTRGFVFDCNGNEVTRSVLGDTWPDMPGTRFRLVMVGRYGSPTAASVDLVCPELDWDTNGGPYVVAPDEDPRTGACWFDGSCTETTAADCGGGAFLGAGVACDPDQRVWGEYLQCGSTSLTLGYPWEFTLYSEQSNVRFRQAVPAGTTSISTALVLAAPKPISKGVGYSVDLDTGDQLDLTRPYGVTLPPTPFRVTIEFTDGGPAEILDVVPSSDAVANRPDLVFYRFGSLLRDQGREIANIEFSPRSTGIAPTSSIINVCFRGAPIDDNDDMTEAVEISFDGGRTWSTHRDPDTGLRIQWGMCLIR